MPFAPRLDLGMFVRGVVVDYALDQLSGLNFTLDGSEA
jgi:hypothetical protein